MKFISGLADCHVPGLFSFVLSERVNPTVGMRRIFYLPPGSRLPFKQGADFYLHPHNHRQSIKLTKLFGNVMNVEFHFNSHPSMSYDYHLWRYKMLSSGLLEGELKLVREYPVFATVKPKPLTIKSPLSLHWSDVHTIYAEPNSAWLVEEGELAPEGNSALYSVDGELKLDSTGLYKDINSRSTLDACSNEIMGKSLNAYEAMLAKGAL